MRFIGQNKVTSEFKNSFTLLLILIFTIHTIVIFLLIVKSEHINKNKIFPDQESALQYGVTLMEVKFGNAIQKDQLNCELLYDFIWKITDSKSDNILYFKSTDGELICLDED